MSDTASDGDMDQTVPDPAQDDGNSDAFGADLLQDLDALRTLGATAAAKPQHASMRVQAKALYRKSAMYQARTLTTNICIVSAPMLFCIFLVLLKFGMQQLMNGNEYVCGCQCTKCCYQGNINNCTSMTNTTCPYECLERNSSNCGIQFSSGAQVAFCDIPHASTWPAIVQTPKDEDRAAINRPKVTMLYTPGHDTVLSDQLSKGLLPQPIVHADALLAAQEYLEQFVQQMPDGQSVPGEALTLLGLKRLGSSSNTRGAAELYIEAALAPGSRSLYALWPDGTCKRMGLLDTFNTSLVTALQAMVNASNSAGVAAFLNAKISALNSTAGGENPAVSVMVSQVTVNCTDVVLTKLHDSKKLQRALFCGNRMAACAGNKVTNSFAGAFDWASTSETAFAPVVYFNDSFSMPDDGSDVGTKYSRKPQLLNMAINSWMSTAIGPDASAELLGVGSLPRKAWPIALDWTPVLGPLLATWILQFLLPVFVSQLVYEKENRLRMMMKMHGLQDGAYWLVQYSWFLALYCVYAATFLAFGAITDLAIFQYNNFGIQTILLFIWGNTMIAQAFLTSCFFTSTRTASVFCYLLVFAMGLFGYLLVRFLLDLQPVNPAYVSWIETLQLVPQLALYRALYEIGSYAMLGMRRMEIGMTATSLRDPSNGMLGVWGMLAGEWAFMMVLAWYLEQVYASGTGNRRHPLYFLDRFKHNTKQQQQDSTCSTEISRRDPTLPVIIKAGAIGRTSSGFKAVFGKSNPVQVKPINLHVMDASPAASPRVGVGNVADMKLNLAPTDAVLNPSKEHQAIVAAAVAAAATAAAATALEVGPQIEPPDVTEERLRVCGVEDYVEHPLVIRGLHKVYPAQDGQAPKLAVRSLDLAVAKGECFGLLGPNGAGKSTSISMLVGLQEPTSGTAIIGGNDISKGMRPIYSIMGLCPQHDLLWATLSGREHLHFYGTLKGMSGAELDAAIEAGLKSVKLWANGVGDKPSGSYSGGMKRRLSVAISLMGSPKVVYLDEPSTGLDPASRRVLWDVIKAAKPGRSIILTTHNMEEAEVLCDRLGIFVSGRLACIGHPKDITSRFCGYLLLTVSVTADREAEARQLVTDMAPGAQLTYNVGGTLKYELPTEQVSLSRVFATMAGSKASDLGVLDWAVANATMEEVFIRITQEMNLKATE